MQPDEKLRLLIIQAASKESVPDLKDTESAAFLVYCLGFTAGMKTQVENPNWIEAGK